MPLGNRLPALFMVDHLPGPVGPIDDQRQINDTRFFGNLPGDTRDIDFSGLSFFELQTEMTLRVGRQGEHHHARGIAIKPVDKERMGEDRLNAGQQTISQMRPPPGHGQKPVWFCDDK